MSAIILNCPRCRHRFNFDYRKGMNDTIVCPGCGEAAPEESYCALALCQACHTKLSIPLSYIFDDDNACPECGKILEPQPIISDATHGTNFTADVVNFEKRHKQQLQDGEIFDKFRIIKLLGKGGMAEVYLAEHLLLKRQCALKLMRDSAQSDDPVSIKRFLQEAKLLNSISHQNIVRVFDVGNDFDRGLLFIAMEYVEGDTLQEILKKQIFREDELLDILEAMASALQALHDAKIVHRDIKPSNIMQNADGILKLMDLGIAKFSGDRSSGEVTLTMEQTTIGTPNYASPEQCRDARDVDIRSDIYCLGASVYHLATGILPFDGNTPVATILNVLHNELDPIENHRRDTSVEFNALIHKMVAKDPGHRPQTPEALLKEIRKVRESKMQNAFVKFCKRLKYKFSRKKDLAVQQEELPQSTISQSAVPQSTFPQSASPFAVPPQPAAPEKKKRRGFFLKLLCNLTVLAILAALVMNYGRIYVAYQKWRTGKEVKAPKLTEQLTRVFKIIVTGEDPAVKKTSEKSGVTGGEHLAQEPGTEAGVKRVEIENLAPHPLNSVKLLTADIRDGHFPVVKKLLPEINASVSYDFGRELPLYSGLRSKTINRNLYLAGEEIDPEQPGEKLLNSLYISSLNSSFTISMDFMLQGEDDETFLELFDSNRMISNNKALSLRSVGGKLRLTIGSRYEARTGITLPKEKWINITICVDSDERMLSIWSENVLLGIYFVPQISLSANYAFFGSERFFTGKVARFVMWNDKFDFEKNSPENLEYRKFPGRNRRPPLTEADNGFMVNDLLSGNFSGKRDNFTVSRTWPSQSYNSRQTYNRKPVMVLIVNLKEWKSWNLVKKLQTSDESRGYIAGKFNVVYLPVADNMKKSDIKQYSASLDIINRLPATYKRDLPQAVFFDSYSKYYCSKSGISDVTLLDVVSETYEAIKSSSGR